VFVGRVRIVLGSAVDLTNSGSADVLTRATDGLRVFQ